MVRRLQHESFYQYAVNLGTEQKKGIVDSILYFPAWHVSVCSCGRMRTGTYKNSVFAALEGAFTRDPSEGTGDSCKVYAPRTH